MVVSVIGVLMLSIARSSRFFDLRNQVQLDSAKLEKIAEYEARCASLEAHRCVTLLTLSLFDAHRIEALTKTLAIW